MNKKGLLIGIIIAVIVALIALFVLTRPAGKEDVSDDNSSEAVLDEEMEDEEEDVEGNGIIFDEEDDGVKIIASEAKESDFYGSWEATSDQALYLYGNFELTIEPGGKWHGNITDEDMNGKWQMEANEMHVVNEWIDVYLAFTADDTLVMQRNTADEGEEESMINTVLVRK